MLWFKKQPEAVLKVGADEVIQPAELPIALDPGLFQHHLQSLIKVVAEAETETGLEAYIASLNTKHQLFKGALNSAAIDTLDLEGIAVLLEAVFSARRRVFSSLKELGEKTAREAIRDLCYGTLPLQERMATFVNSLPAVKTEDKASLKQHAKLSRAMFDFGAELLHFNSPTQYPLMTRWVWDQATVSGALREFIRGNDSLTEIPLGSSPEMFEGARAWMAEQIAEQGIFRDVEFWIDLVLAQAYATYFRSMAEGMLSADFGRSALPGDYIKKFLGIDELRNSGRSRVVKEQPSASS